MAVKIQTLDDLGARPIPQANYRVQGYNAGASQAAIGQVGDALEKTGAQLLDTSDKLQTSYARSALLKSQVDIENQFQNDQDYKTFPERYNAAIAKATSTATDMIDDPRAKAAFGADAQDAATRGYARIKDLQRAKEADYGRSSLIDLGQQSQDAYLSAPDDSLRTAAVHTYMDAIGLARQKGYITAEQDATMRLKFTQSTAENRLDLMQPADRLRALQSVMAGPAALTSDVSQAISTAAQKNGVDAGTLSRIAMVESSGNPSAVNGSSQGLFQFQPETAKQYGLTNPMDAASSADAAARLLKDNQAALTKDLGRAPTQGEIYLAHQQGIGGATALLKDPSRLAIDALTEAYNGNKTKALTALIQNGGSSDMTSGQFAAKWSDKLNGAVRAKTGSFVDFIPPDRLPELINNARVYARADLQTKSEDAIAAAQNGDSARPPLLSDYTLAYGDEGAQKYNDFNKAFHLGSDIHAVTTLTPQQQADLLKTREPVPGSAGYETQQKAYSSLGEAIGKVNDARRADPVAYAMAYKQIPNIVINPGDPNAMQQQISQRLPFVQQNAAQYGTSLGVFTKDEAKSLTGVMEKMTPGQKLGYLSALQTSIKDPQAYRDTVQQIRPDSPVTAAAASYLSAGQSTFPHTFSADETFRPEAVAEKILIGEDLINPAKTDKATNGVGKSFPMPKEAGSTGIRGSFDDYVGNAFVGNPAAEDSAYQAYKAYYAASAAQSGDYSGVLNDSLSSESAKAVVGHVANINGTNVLPPWGMDETAFTDIAKRRFDAAIASNGFRPDVTRWNDSSLEMTAKPGVYRTRIGNGYLLDRKGNPVLIDVNSAPVSAPTPDQKAMVDKALRPIDTPIPSFGAQQ